MPPCPAGRHRLRALRRATRAETSPAPIGRHTGERSRFGSTLVAMLLALGGLAPLPPVAALTLVEPADPDLLRGAHLVVVCRVVSVRASTDALATEIEVEVRRTLKGTAAASVLTVRRPGVQLDLLADAGIAALVVPGLPSFSPDQELILFLGPERLGRHPLHQSALGVFERRSSDHGAAAVRDLSAATVLADPELAAGDRGPSRRLRDWHRFAAWLEDATGDADYLLPDEARLVQQIAEPFTFLGGSPVRWFVFDEGGGVRVRGHVSGLDGANQDVFASLSRAARAWSDDPGSLIDLAFGGSTTASSGLTANDGVSAVLWNDPNGEVSGSYVCGQGGVLGLGGGFTLGSLPFAGATALRLIEGDVVINDGAACFFDGAGGLDGEEILAHELGHTLGLGHTNVQPQQSLMRGTAHGDGRGARLGPDDRDGVAFLYPQPGSAGGEIAVSAAQRSVSESAAGIELLVERRLGTAGQATVDYSTVGVEALPGIDFVAASGQLSWADGEGGTRTVLVGLIDDALSEPPERFRLQLQNAVGAVLSAAQTTVTLLDDDQGGGQVRFRAGATVVDENDGAVLVEVERIGPAATSASVGVRLRGGSARRGEDFTFADTVVAWGPNQGGVRTVTVGLLVDEEIEPVETIVLELHAPTGGVAIGAPDRHVLDVAEAIAPGPCVEGPRTLCLLGGRFRIDGQYATAGGGGLGNAVPLTDDTGYFWFFAPENVEVALKVLDGCGINDRIWVFAGGLTDVETRLRIVDTERDATRVYLGPLGTAFQPIQDTAAFSTCP
ncbi:MAG: hypothetical protein DWQ36_23700 [Acidobacteria bacterium]|nr:MAG: hypothetical protein DWQ30_06890 [Acidobacteriota bacterium]REK00160.1 MAG: hypothetical protein DWQ36_23700 [Acidobacteriota bacterium]